jgi:hypothetical protein
LLYLITTDGEIEEYNWDRLIGGIEVPDQFKNPFRHLISRSTAWYGLAVQDLMQSEPTRTSLRKSVDLLSQRVLIVPRKHLKSLRKAVDTLAMFPSSDIEIFKNVFFTGSVDGLLATPLSIGDFSRDAAISDAPSLRLSASYGQLAIANGSDGLSELLIENPYDYSYGIKPSEPTRISEKRCDVCSWAYFDVVASSTGAGGYVGAFSKPSQSSTGHPDRRFLGTVGSGELFGATGQSGLMFGSGNQLVLANDSGIHTEQWYPYRRREDFGIDVERSLVQTPTLAKRTRFGEPIDAAVTVFGTVVELDDKLVIYGSDGATRTLHGEPISWRVFPRSQRYQNQLHVVRDRWLDVYAFTHDYFLLEAERVLARNRPRASTW